MNKRVVTCTFLGTTFFLTATGMATDIPECAHCFGDEAERVATQATADRVWADYFGFHWRVAIL